MPLVVLSALRVVFGLLTLVAIAWQFSIHIGLGYSAHNFFSYYTNLSNLCAAAVLLIGASRIPVTRSGAWDLVRAVSVVNMALVGMVFGTLLRDVDLGSLRPWINVLLHYVMPCVAVIDWLWQPPRLKLRAGHVLLALAFPALYLLYVLLRGSSVAWYPYPFLNPANVGGYPGVAVYSAGIAVAFGVVSGVLFAIGNRLGRPK